MENILEIKDLTIQYRADNRIVEGKAKIIGHYEKVEPPSEGLLKRLRENGMSFKTQQQLFGI